MASAPPDPELDQIVDGITERILLGALAILVPPIGFVALLLHRANSEGERRFRRRWRWISGTLTALIVLLFLWLYLNTISSSEPRHALSPALLV